MIESVNNPLVKRINALKTKKGRVATGLFILEGESGVRDIPDAAFVDCYVFSRSFSEKADISQYESIARVYVLADHVYDKVSDTVTASGVMALCHKKSAVLPDIMAYENSLVLFAENVSDPGNMGTIIRTAAAAGCSGVVVSAGCADVYSPKVVRSSTGAVLRLPIVECGDVSDALTEFSQNGFHIAAAHVSRGESCFDANLTGRLVILVGNEAGGLSPVACDKADIFITIPMASGVESLNASVACAILLFEAVRQRKNILSL